MVRLKDIVKVIFVSIFLVGCANPPVVQTAGNTYMLSREDHAGIFGSSAKLRAEVIQDANNFAKSKGKVAIPISVREKPVGNSPGDWATFEYQFKLVEENSPEAKTAVLNNERKDLPLRADATTQHTENITADINLNKNFTEPSDNSSPDLYSELLKLDDLLKRGIITEVEFNKLKEDLLSKQ
jgi:hypothetical protein